MKRREFCLAAGAALASAGVASALGRTAPLHLRSVSATPSTQPPPADDDLFAAKVFHNAKNETIPYRLFVPADYETTQAHEKTRSFEKLTKYPLVVWLHGGAGRGTDNLKQISGGNVLGSHVWTEIGNQAKHPCFVVAPQCPENESWAIEETASPTKQLLLVVELLQELQTTYYLDPRRIYVTGQSLGGFGTWSIVSEHPEMFAAAIPVCGGGNESAATKLIKTPIWAFHGEKDQAVSVERSRKMIAAIKQAGGSPKYTEYANEGHAIWEKVFSQPELVSWVFSQKKQNPGKN